jgi:hypothetical protein
VPDGRRRSMSFEEDEIEEVETEADKRYMKDPNAKNVLGFIQGLNLLAPYMKEGVNTTYFLGAEHDIIYIYTESTYEEDVERGYPKEDSPDGLRLSELGFHYDEYGWAYFT